MTDLRYPIGEFTFAGPPDPDTRWRHIGCIAALPARFRAALSGLRPEQLDTPYRPGGWTVRQVAHHVPDSHLNGYVRFRLALTEPTPTITPYDEKLWSGLRDAREADPEPSLALLEALHRRWVLLLERLEPGDWSRAYHHPGLGRDVTLDEALALYAWHGEHHTAHVATLRRRLGWGLAVPAGAA